MVALAHLADAWSHAAGVPLEVDMLAERWAEGRVCAGFPAGNSACSNCDSLAAARAYAGVGGCCWQRWDCQVICNPPHSVYLIHLAAFDTPGAAAAAS